MNSKQILAIYHRVTSQKSSPVTPQFTKEYSKITKLKCVSVADAAFGDSGKGAIAAKLNTILSRKKKLISLGPNGGANAGHETSAFGKLVVTHHMPIAVIQPGATAVITRGKVIHPSDLVSEMDHIKKQFGTTKFPGKLIIDERVFLSLDTHRAFEAALNSVSVGGRGSTARGIATSYADIYLRIALSMRDLLNPNWKNIFKNHYLLYQKLLKGFGGEYEDMENVWVTSFGKDKKKVGSEKEFLERLSVAREKIKPFVISTMYSFLKGAWSDPQKIFTIEFAQAAGLDPYHGVYPDVTSSRPLTRSIGDSTYGVIEYEDISLSLGVTKTIYISSVGIRKLPTQLSTNRASTIRSEQNEFGKSTGRPRDVYEISLPILRYLRRADGYTNLAATHLDAATQSEAIGVVTHYTDKKTGRELPYLPYQDYLDRLKPHIVEFPGWDGHALKDVKNLKDLPREASQYLSFLSQTVAPVALATTGPEVEEYLSWIPGLS